MGGARDDEEVLDCDVLSSAWIDATTKVVIGTCASGAAEPELCVVRVLSVDRIDRIVLTFLLFRSWI